MIIRFPSALDSLALPLAVADYNAGQSSERQALLDAFYMIAAIEKKLGVDLSTDAGSIDARMAVLETGVTEAQLPLIKTPGKVDGGAIIGGSPVFDSATINDAIINDDVVRPMITVGGDESARTFTVQLVRADGTAPANLRSLLHWWCASSSFGGPAAVTDQTYAVTTGVDLLHANTYGLGHGLTDATGTFVVTVSNAHSATPVSVYFLCEFQGIIYQATGQVWTTGAP